MRGNLALAETEEVIKPVAPKPYKKRFGDRPDGRKLRTLEPANIMGPFIFKDRVGSQNLFMDSVDIENIQKFVHKKRAEGWTGFGAMHVLIAAYIRTISQRPGLNRFVNGQYIFARNNIEISLAIKKELKLDAPETLIKLEFTPADTVKDVYEAFNQRILEYQNAGDDDDFESLSRFLGHLPRIILRSAISFLNWLDYHGWIPKSLIKVSPFHGSMILTSMASLGVPPIYHHLYDFGNIPMFISFSAMRHENQVCRDGSVKSVRFLDLKFSMDERICDGHYFSSALHELKRYLLHPELLEVPPEQIVADIE